MLNVAFLWHMHQPDYRDADGVMGMPWVFLHAIKDYYDMPWMLSRHKGLKATFNLTPSLIEQLLLYSDPLKADRFLQLWHQHPSRLGSTERDWIVKICTSCNYDTMVRPFARMAQLYARERFDDGELIDLEVLFMLAWCGEYLRRHNSEVQALIAQERGYTQEQKEQLLETLGAFIPTILPYYRKLMETGVISLSTTPYNHPILPLLIDMNNATAANPATPLPGNPVSLADDAGLHVSRAIALYESQFGRSPTGFWPAEGAVDERSVALYREHGLRWICTDEAILFRSLGSGNRRELLRPYRYDGVTIGFREHALSDLIGFDYRHYAPEAAAGHFTARLKSIASDAPQEATVFVILDGENAWEYYEQNGFLFFEHLYAALKGNVAWCATLTMDEASAVEAPELSRLSPGSWIRGDFTTWVGHREKNRAWELLFQARRDFEHRGIAFEPEVQEKLRRHFMALECSDWYWWYGDDHMTTFAVEFDMLFRRHLMEVYSLMHMDPPADLFEPILEHVSTASFMVAPQSPIHPKIDGEDSSFFEWIGAGSIDESRLYSTMERTRGPIAKIRFGYDEAQNLYLGFEGDVASLRTPGHRMYVIIEELDRRLGVALERGASSEAMQVSVHNSIEIMIPRSLLGERETLHLRFEIECGEQIVQTMPGFGALTVTGTIDYNANWFV